MKFIAITLINKYIKLEFTPFDAIEIVKEKIYEKECSPSDQQNLSIVGKHLEDYKTLSDYRMTKVDDKKRNKLKGIFHHL